MTESNHSDNVEATINASYTGEHLSPSKYMDDTFRLLYQSSQALNEARPENFAPYRELSGRIKSIAQTALRRVESPENVTSPATLAVDMLKASHKFPSHESDIWKLEQLARHYGHVRDQLEKEPHSPILSVYADDTNHDVTIQATIARGTTSWQPDPFRTDSGGPELIVGLEKPMVSPRRLRERTQTYGYPELSPEIQAIQDDPSALYIDPQASVFTDDHDPIWLLEQDDTAHLAATEYVGWIEEYGYHAYLPPRTHLVAVGEQAVGRLLGRIEQELLPVMSSGSKLGGLEAKRTLDHAKKAIDMLKRTGEMATINQAENIKIAVDEELRDLLNITLREHRITVPDGYFTSMMMGECVDNGIVLDDDDLTDRIVEVIYDRYSEDMTKEALRDAVYEEIHSTYEFELSDDGRGYRARRTARKRK